MSDHVQMSLDELGAEDPVLKNLARTMRDGRGMSLAAAVAEMSEYVDPERVQAAAERISELSEQVLTAHLPRAVVAGNFESW